MLELAMRAKQKSLPDRLGTVALFVVITGVSIGLTVWTDLHFIIRILIAVVSGVAAAAVTHAIASSVVRRSGRDRVERLDV